MMAKEACALSELINTFKNKSGTKYFIDIHGWTQQIITDTDNSETFQKAFQKDKFANNSLDLTLQNSSANGYVAKYARALGYKSCLFEFPRNTDPNDFYNDTYGDYFINAVQFLLTQK